MIALIMCALLFSSMSYANKFDEIYHQAAQEYAAKEYQKAAELYAHIEPQSATILYNRALCLYQTKSYVQALLLLKRASLSAHYVLQKRVITLMQATIEHLGQATLSYWYTIILLLVAGSSLIFFQFLFLCAWLCLLFINQKYIRLSAWLLLVLSFFVINCTYYVRFIPRALVVQETTLFVGPDTSYDRLEILTAGQEVKVVQPHDSWYKVVSSHTTGWVIKSDIALL